MKFLYEQQISHNKIYIKHLSKFSLISDGWRINSVFLYRIILQHTVIYRDAPFLNLKKTVYVIPLKIKQLIFKVFNISSFMPKKSICIEFYCTTFSKKKKYAAKIHIIYVRTYDNDCM